MTIKPNFSWCFLRLPSSWKGAAFCASLCLSLIAGGGGFWFFCALPDVKAPTFSYAQELLDENGELLALQIAKDGRYRLPVTLENVDPLYLNMLINFEDKRFYQHHGVDWLALVRAIGQFISSGHVVSGGSTLTMQVAKMMNPQPRTIWAKMSEMRMALALERHYSKQQILQFYLTLAPFGGNIESVTMASYLWFGKSVEHLTPAQAALLVALPQSPEARRPDRFPEAAKQARLRVLQRSFTDGALSAEYYHSAQKSLIPTKRRTFPRLALSLLQLKDFRTKSQVRTTLDKSLQMEVEDKARSYAVRSNENMAALIVEAKTGKIKAYLGSQNYFDQKRHGAFDYVHAIRSPGSTLKPLIYGRAMDGHLIHPEMVIKDQPTDFNAYRPENINRHFLGDVTMTEALRLSLNVPAVKVLQAYGVRKFLADLENVGIHPHGGEGLSVALGGLGLRLYDLAMLYTCLANDGRVVPLSITAPTSPKASHALLSRKTAAEMNWILSSVEAAGTRLATSVQKYPIAYKTGTGPGGSDALAIGTNGAYVVAVWVGSISGAKVAGQTGFQVAAPFMFDLFDLVPQGDLKQQRPNSPPKRLQYFDPQGELDKPSFALTFPRSGTIFPMRNEQVDFSVDLLNVQYPVFVFANGLYLAELKKPSDKIILQGKGDYDLLFLNSDGQQAHSVVRLTP